VRNLVCPQLVGGLLDDLATMRQHQHAFIVSDPLADDLGHHHGFAAAGRGNTKNTSLALRAGVINVRNEAVLVVSEFKH
jgi:hypothetical protein